MLNRVILMGRLVKDPELRYTQSQKPVASFTIAVERDYAERGQDRATDFVDCVAWQGAANFIHAHFVKGQMIAIAGRLQFRDWQDKDGKARRNAEILVENAYFADSKGKPTAEAKPAWSEEKQASSELPF